MSKGNYRSSLLALVLILLALLAQPATGSDTDLVQANQPISAEIEFSLTSEATGWLRSGSRIFRTESNGVDWQDVTPDLKQNESLLDVYFLDSIVAVTLTVSINGEEWQLNLLKTTDAGVTWQAQPITLPKVNRDLAEMPFGNAFVQWQSNGNGWILIKQATSSNFSRGVLLKTSDGGLSWQAFEPPAAEEFVFLDENLGFMRDPVNPTRVVSDSGWRHELATLLAFDRASCRN